MSGATAADLLAIPEELRFHEIIGGEIVEKANPSFEHGGAQGRTFRVLDPYDRGAGGPPARPGGWWLSMEVEIEFEKHEVYRPDVVGWRRDRVPERPRGTPIAIRPDWVCEILSPRNTANDLVKKKRVYQRCQVGHYWIVDPMNEMLTVYRWGPDGYIEIRSAVRGERVKAEPFEAVDLQVGVLFGDDPDER